MFRLIYDSLVFGVVLSLLVIVFAQQAELQEMHWEFHAAEHYLTKKLNGYDHFMAEGRNHLTKLQKEQIAQNFILDLHREYLKDDGQEIDELRQFFVNLRDKITL